MIVVVGGSSRKVGKTTVVCEIIAATPEARWTAIKVSPDDHEPGPTGDTCRYLAAGAVNARLMKEVPELTGNVILESNRILDVLTPDLFVFVAGDGEWKPNVDKYAKRADFVVHGHDTPPVLSGRQPGATDVCARTRSLCPCVVTRWIATRLHQSER